MSRPPQPPKTRSKGEATPHDLSSELRAIQLDRNLASRAQHLDLGQSVVPDHPILHRPSIPSHLLQRRNSDPLVSSERYAIVSGINTEFGKVTPIKPLGQNIFIPTPSLPPPPPLHARPSSSSIFVRPPRPAPHGREKRTYTSDTFSASQFQPHHKRINLESFSDYRQPIDSDSDPEEFVDAPIAPPEDFAFARSSKILRSPTKFQQAQSSSPPPPPPHIPLQEELVDFELDLSSLHLSEPDSLVVYSPRGSFTRRKPKSTLKTILKNLTKFSSSSSHRPLYPPLHEFYPSFPSKPLFHIPHPSSALVPSPRRVHFIPPITTTYSSYPPPPPPVTTYSSFFSAFVPPVVTYPSSSHIPHYTTTTATASSRHTYTIPLTTASSSTHHIPHYTTTSSSTHIPSTATTTSTTMASISYTLPGSQQIYDGTSNCANFLENFDNMAKVFKWDAATKKAQFGFHLSGPAKSAFKMLTRVNPSDDFDTLSPKFVALFKSKSTPEEYSRRLEQRKLLPNETPESYYFDILKLCHKVQPKMDLPTLMSHLVRGLPPKLGREILMKDYKYSADVLDHLLRDARYQSIMGKSSNIDVEDINLIDTVVAQSLAKLGIKTKKEINSTEGSSSSNNNNNRNYNRNNPRRNYRGNNSNNRGNYNNSNRGYYNNNGQRNQNRGPRNNNNSYSFRGNNRGNYRGNYNNNNYRGRGYYNNYNNNRGSYQPRGYYQPQYYQPQFQSLQPHNYGSMPPRQFMPQNPQQRALTHFEASQPVPDFPYQENFM